MSLYVIANEVTLYPKGKQSPKGEIAASLRSSQEHHCEMFMPLTSRQKILDYLKRNRIASSQESGSSPRLGVTGAVCAIAETGSLLLTGRAAENLTASLLPQIHAVVLRASQIVSSLEEALRYPEVRSDAAAVLISGPSRTADIEMTLTIGVHGPEMLHVFVVEDA